MYILVYAPSNNSLTTLAQCIPLSSRDKPSCPFPRGYIEALNVLEVYWCIEQWTVFVLCPLFGVSLIRGSTIEKELVLSQYGNTTCTCIYYVSLLLYSIMVQVLIPVSGRRSTGHLRSTTLFRDGHWHLTHLVLEFRGRTEKLVILDDSEN